MSMSNQAPGLECMQLLLSLKDNIKKNVIRPPIPFVLHNHKQGYAGVINSHSDIELIQQKNFILGIKIHYEGGVVVTVTPDKEFSLKVGRDASGRAVFLSTID